MPELSTTRPHVTVIGAGVIGAATAWELAEQGARVTLIDPALRRRWIDAVPIAMLHPATGPKAAISHRRAAGFDHARQRLARWLGAPQPTEVWDAPLRTVGCLRLTSVAKRAALWQQAAEQWRDRMVWLEPDECGRHTGPDVRLAPGPIGGVWIPDAMAVHTPRLVRVLRDLSGAGPCVDAAVGVEPSSEGVSVSFPDGRKARFDAAVVAAPAREVLERLGVPPLRRVPGEVVAMQAPPPRCAVGEKGQVIPMGPNRVLVSSTYGRDDAPIGVTEAAARSLPDRAAALSPAYETAVPDGAWAGARTTCGDRAPLVDRVAERTFVCTAFGSKGLLVGLWAASRVARAVIDDLAPDTPEAWRVDRGRAR